MAKSEPIEDLVVPVNSNEELDTFLEMNKGFLVKFLDVSKWLGAGPVLFRGVIPVQKVMHYHEREGRRKAAEFFIQELIKSDAPGKWATFRDALRENEGSDIIRELYFHGETDSVVMQEHEQHLLELISGDIIQQMETDIMCEEVFSRGMINSQDKEQVIARLRNEGPTTAMNLLLCRLRLAKDCYPRLLDLLWSLDKRNLVQRIDENYFQKRIGQERDVTERKLRNHDDTSDENNGCSDDEGSCRSSYFGFWSPAVSAELKAPPSEGRNSDTAPLNIPCTGASASSPDTTNDLNYAGPAYNTRSKTKARQDAASQPGNDGVETWERKSVSSSASSPTAEQPQQEMYPLVALQRGDQTGPIIVNNILCGDNAAVKITHGLYQPEDDGPSAGVTADTEIKAMSPNPTLTDSVEKAACFASTSNASKLSGGHSSGTEFSRDFFKRCDCGKTFVSADKLKAHRDSGQCEGNRDKPQAAPETEFSRDFKRCDCGKTFVSAYKLKEHRDSGQCGAYRDKPQPTPGTEFSRDFFKRCDCGKTFPSADKLKAHTDSGTCGENRKKPQPAPREDAHKTLKKSDSDTSALQNIKTCGKRVRSLEAMTEHQKNIQCAGDKKETHSAPHGDPRKTQKELAASGSLRARQTSQPKTPQKGTQMKNMRDEGKGALGFQSPNLVRYQGMPGQNQSNRKSKSYRCITCGREFESSAMLDRHRTNCPATQGTGPIASGASANSGDSRQNSDSKDFLCSVCDGAFETLKGLRIHQTKMNHNDTHAAPCDGPHKTQKESPTSGSLSVRRTSQAKTSEGATQIRNKRDEEEGAGQIASGASASSGDSRQNSDSKNFPCSVCDRAFPTLKGLRIHQTKVNHK